MKDWRIFIAVPPEDKTALQEGLDTFYSWRLFSIIEWDQPEELAGRPELVLDVAAENEEGALAEASDIYDRARAVGGLPDAPAKILGYNIPTEVGEDLDASYWNRGGAAIDDGNFGEAVVAVQTSCEILATRALDGLAAAQGLSWIMGLCERRPVNLSDRVTQTLFNGLSGMEIQKQPWWPDYLAHLSRRNGVVHRGDSVNHSGAQASIEAGTEFRGFVRSALDAPGPPDSP